jgi:signal transduction histidine kinase
MQTQPVEGERMAGGVRPRLLVVDDEVRHVEALCSTLEADGYEVTGFTSPMDAVESLRTHAYDVLLTDLMMPGMDGITLLTTALEIDPDLVGVLMTGEGTVATAVDAMKVGALDYILKPFKLSAIRPVLTRALSVRRLRMENIRLREAIGIYQLSQSMAGALDTDAILEKVADAAFQQSHAGEVLVLVSRVGEKDLRVAATRSLGVAPKPGRRVPITSELLEWAFESRDWISHLDDRQTAQPPQAPGLTETPSRLSIPMLAGGRLAGVLTFEPVTDRSIPLGQIRALSVLASSGAAALEVASLVERLHRTNDDLRQVAWAASHDLQEPLRMVALYTELLARTYHGQLDEKSSELVSFAAEGARRILGMLRDLRAYVEAGDCARGPDTGAESGHALGVAIAELRPVIDECQAQIVFTDLPLVRMSDAHLTHVFHRLLDNALKFRRPDEAPRVEVSAARDGDVWVFSILDRGIGIDPAYHAQIFELFRRLNRREHYAGNGMGLPICRRIVEAYGGSIWVDPKEGQAARFCFTVPAFTAPAFTAPALTAPAVP